MRITAKWYVRGGIYTNVVAEHRKKGWTPAPASTCPRPPAHRADADLGNVPRRGAAVAPALDRSLQCRAMTHPLQSTIDLAWEHRASLDPANSPEIRDAVEHVIAELNAGSCASPSARASASGRVNQWVKKAVLLSFRLNDNQPMHAGDLAFYDKVPTKFAHLDEAAMRATGVRVVPPAVARRGCFIAKNVVLMPSYVNIGAYVDEGTMVDTWATVGSCAQIGKNVHLSGGVGIGGVLEPLQANPTIIEDNCFIGARSEVVEGVIVEENSVHLDGRLHRPEHARSTTARPARSATAACRPARWSSAAPCPRPTAATACTARSSSSASTRRRAPRPASTSCCATDASAQPPERTARSRSRKADECGNMERVLRLMAEKGASDVYLSANSPILIKINGQLLQLSDQLLTHAQPRQLLAELLTPSQLEELDDTGELNIGVGLAGVGSFRLSGFKQRGTIAAVFRCIPFEIPTLESLNVPAVLNTLVLEKRGLILMVGATGAGKSTTLASMLEQRNQQMAGHILTIEDPIEFLFNNKKSVVNQREVGRDTQSLQIALKNALRQAPDVHPDRRDPRPRDDDGGDLVRAVGPPVLATLHANNSYHALGRILSFYPPEVRPTLLADLAAGLRAIVSQRLLRTSPAAACRRSRCCSTPS